EPETQTLVAWSSSTRQSAQASHPASGRRRDAAGAAGDAPGPESGSRPGSGMGADLAIAVQIVHAAAAEFRMGGVLADIGAVVPAAAAFLVRRDANLDLQGAVARHGLGGRCDEDELQVVLQRLQQGQVLGRGRDGYLGLQRSADLAFGAHGLDVLVDLVADFAD